LFRRALRIDVYYHRCIAHARTHRATAVPYSQVVLFELLARAIELRETFLQMVGKHRLA
jgi:hypothetical protein